MTRKTRKNTQPISSRPQRRLDEMASEFDREFVADTFGPPSSSARLRHRRAKKKRGRPRVGSGSQAVSVTIEKTLLRKIDQIAKKRKTNRAQLIARGLRVIVQEELNTTR